MAFPSFTKTWHNNTYPAIDPTNAALSAANKTVFITGGGAGVGAGIVDAFASAGASRIAINGRTEKTLLAKKQEIESKHPSTTVVTFVADITDEKALDQAFASLGKVDVLVHNAGAMADLVPVPSASISDWWSAIEINIKGSFLVTRSFLKVAAPNAILINVTTAAVHLTPFPNQSGYVAGKVATNKFFEAVQVENPELFVVSVHPGVVQSAMSQKASAGGIDLPFDDASLVGNTTVWLSSPEAQFLKGKSVWCNWDVEELKEQADKIKSSPALTLGLVGLLESGYTANMV